MPLTQTLIVDFVGSLDGAATFAVNGPAAVGVTVTVNVCVVPAGIVVCTFGATEALDAFVPAVAVSGPTIRSRELAAFEIVNVAVPGVAAATAAPVATAHVPLGGATTAVGGDKQVFGPGGVIVRPWDRVFEQPVVRFVN